MMSDIINGREFVPSEVKSFLNVISGRLITEMVRYSWFPFSKEEFGLPASSFFSLTAGAVAITFDSHETIGIGSHSSWASISLWIEKDCDGKFVSDEPMALDTDLYPISADDPVFSAARWRSIIGQEISSISIISRKYESPLFEGLPNEVGLIFRLRSGGEFVVSHGLHDDSDDFSVIFPDDIPDHIRADLTEIPINSLQE